jgi:hypothetical protein
MKSIFILFLLFFSLSLSAQTYSELSEQAIDCIEKDSLVRAEELLVQAMKLEPSNPYNALLFSNLGLVQKRLGRYDDALQSYTYALNIAPTAVPILLDRAALYMEKGMTDRAYPDYWATQDAISYLGGGYSEIHGNPFLKPNIDYQAQLTYVLKSKYMFTAWYSQTKDYSTQTLYQSPDRLLEIYKYLNFDKKQQIGLQTVIPFKVKEWLSSRITLIGVYDRQNLLPLRCWQVEQQLLIGYKVLVQILFRRSMMLP